VTIVSRWLIAGVGLVIAFASAGCRDLGRFDSGGGHYEGGVIAAQFVRTGIASDTRMCLTLDTERLDDAPGTVTTSDGRLTSAQLHAIPPIAHDPLSTLSFGSGRTKNVMLAARARADAGEQDLLVIVSLMDSGGVEVRLLEPAFAVAATADASESGDAGAPAAGSLAQPMFAVFPLEKKPGACPFGSP
jgi:hypothetical protein